MKWKEISTDIGIRVLSAREAPLLLKEGAWRLVRFVAKCGRSNPFSFALRPIAYHRKLRVGLGLSLAVFVIVAGIVKPLALVAGDNTGGSVEMVFRPVGEPVLATEKATRIPIEHYTISQGFWAFHPGLDMASRTGEPVYSMSNGEVSRVEHGWLGYGNYIVIDHGGGYESLYAHLSKTNVKEGEKVTTNSVIGLVGSVGHSTGPHLHFEIHQSGAAINPALILGIK